MGSSLQGPHGSVPNCLFCWLPGVCFHSLAAAAAAFRMQDISSRYAAVLFGITNALSSLMGTCSVYATGLILESTESWSLVFQLVAAFYLLGAVGFLAWASAEQQFE